MSRKSITLLFLLIVSFWSGAAAAADAKNFVDTVGQKVLAIVNGAGGESARRQQLQQMFRANVDMDWMGQFVLGHSWNEASQTQRDHYLEAYRKYLLARYTTRFADYTGAKYDITGVKEEANGQYTVSMQIKTPDGDQNTQAGYRLRPEGGSFKIIDIIVEGISQITTQRSEFASVIQQKGIDGLIAAIEAKAQTAEK